MKQLLASLSAAIAAMGFGAALFCGWRWRVVWTEPDLRRSTRLVLLGGVIALLLGVAFDQAQSVVGLYTGIWPVWMGGLSRGLWIAGVLACAAAATWVRWRHRGWLTLLAIVVVIGLLLAAMKPV